MKLVATIMVSAERAFPLSHKVLVNIGLEIKDQVREKKKKKGKCLKKRKAGRVLYGDKMSTQEYKDIT